MPLVGNSNPNFFSSLEKKYNQQLQSATKNNPIGPGFGNYGSQDIYRPRNGEVLGQSVLNNYSPPPTQSVNTGGGGGGSRYNDLLGQDQAGTLSQSGIDELSRLKDDIQNPQQSGELDAINNEFNAFSSLLDQQVGQANQNFTDTKGLYDTQRTNAQQRYETEQASQTGEIKSNERLNLKRVRQLLRDLSQGNAARTAVTGGGSTSEVLAERFGREAQSRLGNVMDQTQQATTRVNDFYNNSISKLQETYDSSILQAKQSLQQNLSNIQAARNQSAAAKQQGNVSAWKDYYNNVNQAKIQAATFKAQYGLWKQQQDSQLAATSGFNLNNIDALNEGISSSYSDQPQAPGTQDIQDPYGTTRRIFGNRPYDEEEDQTGINNPYLFSATNKINNYLRR